MGTMSLICFLLFLLLWISQQIIGIRQTKCDFEKSTYFVTGHIDLMSPLKVLQEPKHELKIAHRQLEAPIEMRMQST